MAGVDHAHFLPGLARLVRTQGSDDSRLLARSALMWLSVTQRPLRAHELWVAVQVEFSTDEEHVERLLTEPSCADDGKASASLQRLLGDLISITTDSTDSKKLHVCLADPELGELLTSLGDLHVPEDMLSPAFSIGQAHGVVANVCMSICSVTTLHLSHAHNKKMPSSLIRYAWTYWKTHLTLSGCALADERVARLANSMIFNVCADVQVFLLKLCDFVTGPIVLPSARNPAETVALVMEAQQALQRPIALMSLLIKFDACAETLHVARQVVESAQSGASMTTEKQLKMLIATIGMTPTGPTSPSNVEILRIGQAMSRTERLLGVSERQLVRSFAEIARSLRALLIPITRSPFYEKLLEEFEREMSPLDILLNVAEWMEALAAYPYRGEYATISSNSSLNPANPDDPNDYAASLMLTRPRARGSSRKKVPTGSEEKPLASRPPAHISSSRWLAARAVFKFKASVSGTQPGSTFVINDLRHSSQRASLFASLATELGTSGESFVAMHQFNPNPVNLKHHYPKGISSFLKRKIARLTFFEPSRTVRAASPASNAAENRASLKASMLSEGFRMACCYCGMAILLHHIRRTLFPWLGAFLYFHSIEEMRLAISNPDVFLDEALSFPWYWFVFSSAMKICIDAGAGLGIRTIMAQNDPEVQEAYSQWDARIPMARGGRGVPVVKVLYITWALSVLEFAFDRHMTFISFMIAYSKLLTGGDVEHTALGNILKAHWLHAIVTSWLLSYFAWYGVWPILRAAAQEAILGQPAVLLALLAVGGTVYGLLRYHSTFYLAIELGGLFVVSGLVLLTVVLLGVELYDDPLGVKTSTVMLQRRAGHARTALPPGADDGAQRILAGRAVLPVKRLAPLRDKNDGSLSRARKGHEESHDEARCPRGCAGQGYPQHDIGRSKP